MYVIILTKFVAFADTEKDCFHSNTIPKGTWEAITILHNTSKI
jgi:hypothetical protein